MSMSTRHKHTLKGRFVLRADSIRPYSLGGEAAAIHRTARLRQLREAKSLPYMASAILQPSQILKRTVGAAYQATRQRRLPPHP